MNTPRHALLLACAASFTLFSLALPASAANKWWVGNLNNNFNTAGNWYDSAVPALWDSVYLSSLVGTYASINQDVARSLTTISMESSATKNMSWSGSQTLQVSNLIQNLNSTYSLTFNNTVNNYPSANYQNLSIYPWPGAITIQQLNMQNAGSSAANLTVAGAGTLTINNGISGSSTGYLFKDGSGLIIVAAASTYSGATYLREGIFEARVLANAGTASSIGTGSTDPYIYLYPATGKTMTFRYNSSSVGSTDRRVVLGTSSEPSATGEIYIQNQGSGALTFSASAFNYPVNAVTATRTLALTGAGTGNATISGVIADNSSSGKIFLRKEGAGTWILNGANTFTGGVLVRRGRLQAGNNSALGNGNVVVTNEPTLEAELVLPGSITISRPLWLYGTGVSSAGALRNTSGNNTYSGVVTLGSPVFIGVDAGTLTISGAVGGAFPLTKVGSGTLTLSGNNTYSGITSNNGGTIILGHANGLGASSAGTVINSGYTLDLNGQSSVAEPLVLNGTGVSSAGALINSSGTAASHSGAISLNSASSIGGAGNATLSGVISGANALTKVGAGTFTLSANNTYSGGTTISAGTLQIGAGGTSGSIAGNIVDNAALVFNRSDALTYAGVISGSGTVTKQGAGSLTLSGNNTYSGATTINGGTLILGHASALGTTAGNTTVNSGYTLDLNGQSSVAEPLVLNGTGVGSGGALINSSGTAASHTGTISLNSASSIGGAGNATLSGVISGANTLTKVGAGTFTLSGNNTYSGTTTISAGALRAAHANALGATSAGSSVSSGAALELNGGIAVGAEALSLNGSGISSGGALRNVSGNNSYAGAITQGSASLINSDSGTLTLSGGISGAYGLTIGGADNVTVNTTAIAIGAGTLTKDGAGTLTMGVANTYSGKTSINGGTLSIAQDNHLGTAPGSATPGHLDFNGGTLAATATFTLNSNRGIALTGAGTINVASGQTLTYGGIAAGSGALTKAGDGTLILSGNNTYGGATTISAGALQIGNNGAAGALASATIANSGTLTFFRSDDIACNAVISGAGTLVKLGAGMLTLSASNTYSGATHVSNGLLRVNGFINASSGLIVAPGAALGGTGLTCAVTLNSNGRLDPGLSIGILRTGNLTMQAGSRYTWEFNSTTSDWVGAQTLSLPGAANSVTVSITRLDSVVYPVSRTLSPTLPSTRPQPTGSSSISPIPPWMAPSRPLFPSPATPC